MAKTGTIRGRSRELGLRRENQELGLEFLQQRGWFRKLCYFLKISQSDRRTNLPVLFLYQIDLAMKETVNMFQILELITFFLKVHFFHQQYLN